MKLLSKQSVADQTNAQRKVQIDEGVLIAKKVDALRQTLANLEAQHRAFIDGIKREADRETTHLLERIAELKLEVAELEERRKESLVPLDQAWESVSEKEKKAEKLVRDAETDRKKTLSALESAESKSKEAKETASRVRVRERELAKAYLEAESSLKDAEKSKLDAEMILQSAEREAQERLLQLAAKEEAFANGEKANQAYRQLLDSKEQELNVREARINDRYETLERTIKRLQK